MLGLMDSRRKLRIESPSRSGATLPYCRLGSRSAVRPLRQPSYGRCLIFLSVVTINVPTNHFDHGAHRDIEPLEAGSFVGIAGQRIEPKLAQCDLEGSI
jgi:hypothetical protein